MKFRCIGIGLAVGLPFATPALACLYTHAPEPVGGPTATFVARRMVDAAAYVDIAVAESSQSARSPLGEWPVSTVTFRTRERLKGASPERFSLFASGLKPVGSEVEAAPLLHWVDEKTGGVYPHATRWEPIPDEAIGTSCDPGFIEPVRGAAYLIFRDAKGRLLGPVEFHAGQRPTRGYAFVQAAPDTEWVRAVRLNSALRSPRAEAPGTGELPPPVAVDTTRGSAGFRRLLTVSEARGLLSRAGARPYVVYTSVGGMQGAHRVPPEQASLEAVGGARPQAAAQIGSPSPSRGIAARAQAVLDEYTAEQLARDASRLEYARMLIGAVAREHERAAEARSNGPFIYGVEFLGGPEVRKRLSASPLVGEVHQGFTVRGRPAAPQPANAVYAPPASTPPPAVAALNAVEIHARLQALAAELGAEAPARR